MFRTHLFPQTSTVLTCLLSVCLLSQPTPVEAGCGCTKAPPAPAHVRPHATYAGTEVTLFHPALHAGQGYDVTFTSGITGESASVSSQAVSRRDLADGHQKPQLVVVLPSLPLGPTSISVGVVGQDAALLALDDAALTVVPQPLPLPTQVGETFLEDFQAAVGRDGTVYVSLDLTGTTLPRTFRTQTLGYPLRFTHDEVIIYNIQGFVMQLIDEGMPGLASIETGSASDSDILQYSRHEFQTYFLQHAERQQHAVHASDANWHQDGSPHIDHNHLVVAIAGMLADGSLPEPGATPAFDLLLDTYSLFHHGLVGNAGVDLSDNASLDSYHSQQQTFSAAGQVRSNGTVKLSKNVLVDGDAFGAAFEISGKAKVTGDIVQTNTPLAFMPVEVPSGLEDLDFLNISNNDSLTLVGPASFHASRLRLRGQLVIDNTHGPVTLYVTGPVSISGTKGEVIVTDPNPEKFAMYVIGAETVQIRQHATFYGVVYAPESAVSITSKGEFFGAFVGDTVTLDDQTQMHYDQALRGE